MTSNIILPDKLLVKELEGKEYIMATDEGEAISIGCGYYYAKRKPANIYISADGFMNALNAITSLVIPEKIPMNIFVSIGRTEPQHMVATYLVPKIIALIKQQDETEGLHFQFIKKE